jgi:carbon-monoxide dehydrogenase iron sulfur subunit
MEATMKRVFPREEYCMGCRLCEVACITVHSESGDTVKAYKKEFPREPSRIWFEESQPECFSFMCRHCEEPDCLEACISGAILKDQETGIYA